MDQIHGSDPPTGFVDQFYVNLDQFREPVPWNENVDQMHWCSSIFVAKSYNLGNPYTSLHVKGIMDCIEHTNTNGTPASNREKCGQAVKNAEYVKDVKSVKFIGNQ